MIATDKRPAHNRRKEFYNIGEAADALGINRVTFKKYAKGLPTYKDRFHPIAVLYRVEDVEALRESIKPAS